MTRPPIPIDERGPLAGEYALGILAGDDLSQAQELYDSDPEFRTEVARWTVRLSPLLDEVDPVDPPQHVQAAIERRIGGTFDSAGAEEMGDNVVALRRRVSLWRGVAAGSAALAASLALVVFTRPAQLPPAPVPAPVETRDQGTLLAVLGDEQKATKMVASFDPDTGNLVVAAAGEMAADPGHSHELWVIPADGTPRSLGLIPQTARMRTHLADPMARQLQQGATLAISVEPTGGSTTGLPTGPVIASGALERA